MIACQAVRTIQGIVVRYYFMGFRGGNLLLVMRARLVLMFCLVGIIKTYCPLRCILKREEQLGLALNSTLNTDKSLSDAKLYCLSNISIYIRTTTIPIT